jgi:nitrogen fixation NifU-like protein
VASDFKELEEMVVADMRRIYSEKVIDHFLNPRNLGEMQSADGLGRATGSCGDTMQIYLRVRNGKISDAKFITDGCGTSIACGSMVTEMVKGKGVAEALRVTQEEVLDALEGLPEENEHCALLAADTLREAIKDYLAFKHDPWKRAYQKG